MGFLHCFFRYYRIRIIDSVYHDQESLRQSNEKNILSEMEFDCVDKAFLRYDILNVYRVIYYKLPTPYLHYYCSKKKSYNYGSCRDSTEFS